MSPADILDGLLHLNLVGAAAVVAVLALRPFARRLFGPSVAYALWLAVPAAVLAIALPARRLLLPSLIPAQAATPNVASPVVMAAGPLPGDPRPWLIALWIAGALAFAAVLIWRQRQLLISAGRLALTSDRSIRRADAKGIGPAVVGAFNPHVIVPSDFEDRFDAEERVLVLAHEWAHLRRQDARINGLVALIQCGLWFNPLVHLAARAIRMDQELACDAAVITQFPDARRRYAEAMLKTQVTTTPLPFGCYWPANSLGPLKERIAMLKLKAPSRVQRLLGGGVIAALALGAGAAAWAAKPAEVVFETEVAAPIAPTAPAAYAEAPAPTPAPQARPARAARAAAAPQVAPSADAAFSLAEIAPPAPPPPPPAPPAPPRAARPPAPPPVPPVPPAPRTPRVAMTKGGMIRCKLDAAGHPASCSMPAFGEPKAGEVDVPFTPPDMSAFREQLANGEFKNFDKGPWKGFDNQVFIERGRALGEAQRARGEADRARGEAERARGEAMRARAIDARKLGELGRKQGELERRAAELTARNASASEISAARAAADANRAQLDAEAKRVGEEAAKLGADVRVRIAPRAEPDPRPAPKVRP